MFNDDAGEFKSLWLRLMCIGEWLESSGLSRILSGHDIVRRENRYASTGLVLFLFYGILFGCGGVLGMCSFMAAPVLAALAGLPGVPSQSAVSRFLAHVEAEAFQAMSNEVLQLLRQNTSVRGRFIAFDGSYLEVYGRYQFAEKVWSYIVKRTIKGFKLLVVYDVEAGVPLLWRLVPANHHDNPYLLQVLRELRHTYKVRTVLADKAFYDSRNFRWLCRHRIRFIIPAKEYAPVQNEMKEVTLEEVEDGRLIGETTFYATGCRSRLRLVVIQFEDRRYGLLTNDWRSPASRIHELYKLRWRVENFFKDLKENYAIKKFPGTTINVVEAHIQLVMIAYLTLKLYRLQHGLDYTITRFRRKLLQIEIKIEDSLKHLAATFTLTQLFKLTTHKIITSITQKLAAYS